MASLTEYHRADAHDGAALLDGDGVVVGHALGELTEGGLVGKVGGLELVEEGLHLAELAAHLLHIVGVAAHGHEARDAHVGQLAPGLGGEHRTALVDGEAILGLLLGDVYLQEAVDDTTVLGGMLVDLA